jgi:hypothetical protein
MCRCAVQEGTKHTRAYVCSDVDDPYCPLPSQCWLPVLGDSREQYDRVLASIATCFNSSVTPLNCMGAAVKTVVHAMEDYGRLVVFQAGLGGVGEGRLVTRESAKCYQSPEEEHSLMFPDPKQAFYSTLGHAAAAKNVRSLCSALVSLLPHRGWR